MANDCPALIPLLSFFSARVERGVYAIPVAFLEIKYLSCGFGEASSQLSRFSADEILEAVDILYRVEFAIERTLKPSSLIIPIPTLVKSMVNKGLIASCEMAAVLSSRHSAHLVTRFVTFATPEHPECPWETMNPYAAGFQLNFEMSMTLFCPNCHMRIGVDHGGRHVPDECATQVLQSSVTCIECTTVVGRNDNGNVVFRDPLLRRDVEFDRAAETAYRSYVESC